MSEPSHITERLLVRGVGREEEAPGGALTIYFNRRPTDSEMRAIHEGLRGLINGDWTINVRAAT